jgi:hypothetical protein
MHRPPPRMQHLHSLMKLNTWGDVCLNAHQTPAGNAAWCGGGPTAHSFCPPLNSDYYPTPAVHSLPQQLHLLNNWCSVPLFSSSWIASLDLRLLPMHLPSLTYRASWTRPLRLQKPASCHLAMTLQATCRSAAASGSRPARRSKFFFLAGVWKSLLLRDSCGLEECCTAKGTASVQAGCTAGYLERKTPSLRQGLNLLPPFILR